MAFSEIEKKVLDTIDENSEKIISLGKKVLDEPELGYREFKTSALVKD